MIKLILTYFCSCIAIICHSQNDCWVKTTTFNDSYLKVIKVSDNKYFCSASNIWGNSVRIHVYESEDLLSWEPTNIEFPSRFNLLFNKDSDGNLYAGTQEDGVFVSRDSGASWEPKAVECPGCGALSFEEDQNGTIYVGTGGLLRGCHVSYDNGNSWMYNYGDTNITDIESSPETNKTYFVNTSFVLFWSDNDALDLHQFSSLDFSTSTLFTKYIKGALYAFTVNGNVYKFTEDESSAEFYSRIPLTGLPRPYFNDVIVQADTWYVTIDNSGIYKSYDNGINWEYVPCNLTGLVNYLFLDNFKIAATTTEGIYVIDECSGLIEDQPQTDTFPLNSNALFTIHTKVTPTAYQWQIFNGTDFENIMDSDQYSGTGSNELLINGISPVNQNQVFRCVLTFGDCISISDEANLFVSETISTYSSEGYGKVSISPNPASLNLQIDTDFDEKKKFEILDINGVLVLSGILNNKNVNVDVSNIPAGLYIFSIEGDYSPIKFIKLNR